jgi:hypothetical protein
MTTFSPAARPAKHIQRLMVIETLRRLRPFASFEQYEYLGFGGFEFIDFQLVRRELGIVRMISIERSGSRERYEFNLPYSEITLKFGRAKDFLADLDWDPFRIVWLDYTGALNAEALDDVRDVIDNAVAGSFLIVTVDAQPPIDGERRPTLEARLVGVATVPGSLTERDLGRWGYAEAQYKILLRWIERRCSRRADKATFKQLLHFNYFDTREMLTVGGLILHPSAAGVFAQCRFEDLEFVRDGADPLPLTVPELTQKEVAHLNHQLPALPGNPPVGPGLDPDEVGQYTLLYRWYPAVA